MYRFKKPTLSELDLLATAWLCFPTEPQIDYVKLGELSGQISGHSAKTQLNRRRKELSDEYSSTGGEPKQQIQPKTPLKKRGLKGYGGKPIRRTPTVQNEESRSNRIPLEGAEHLYEDANSLEDQSGQYGEASFEIDMESVTYQDLPHSTPKKKAKKSVESAFADIEIDSVATKDLPHPVHEEEGKRKPPWSQGEESGRIPVIESSLEEDLSGLADRPYQDTEAFEMGSATDMDPTLATDLQSAPIVFEIVEDVPGTLEAYIRLGRMGCFDEAAKLFTSSLCKHARWFPVAAEHAEVLYRQGDFEALLGFLNETLASDLADIEHVGRFTDDERCILLLFQDVANLSRRIHLAGDPDLENYRAAAKRAEEYSDRLNSQTLSRIQSKLLAMLFDLSTHETSRSLPLSQRLFDTFFNLCHEDIRKAEVLIRAANQSTTTQGTGAPQSSIAVVEKNLLHHFEVSDPPEVALCVVQLSTAIVFCETNPLCSCNDKADEVAYRRMKTKATALQNLLRDRDESYTGSGLDIRLALLDLDEGIISGNPSSLCILMMKQHLMGAIKNMDLRLQREIRGRITLLTSISSSTLDSPPRFTADIVAKYSRFSNDEVTGVYGSVLRSLVSEALGCFDALQVGVPADIVLKILTTRMRLWHWAESVDLLSGDVVDDDFSDDGEDSPGFAYGAEDIAGLESIVKRFSTPRATHNAAITTQQSLFQGISEQTAQELISKFRLSRSAWQIDLWTEAPNKKPVFEVDTTRYSKSPHTLEIISLLSDTSYALRSLEKSHSIAQSRRRKNAREDIDSFTHQDASLLHYLKFNLLDESMAYGAAQDVDLITAVNKKLQEFGINSPPLTDTDMSRTSAGSEVVETRSHDLFIIR